MMVFGVAILHGFCVIYKYGGFWHALLYSGCYYFKGIKKIVIIFRDISCLDTLDLGIWVHLLFNLGHNIEHTSEMI